MFSSLIHSVAIVLGLLTRTRRKILKKAPQVARGGGGVPFSFFSFCATYFSQKKLGGQIFPPPQTGVPKKYH